MPSLDVFAYRFPNDAASLAAYEAVMHLIAGGSAYRLHTPDGSQPPTLAVFAFANTPQLRAACRAAGGTPTTLAPDLLHDLTVRSLHAAERGIVGKRHHAPGTPAGEALPDDPGDYSPRDASGESGKNRGETAVYGPDGEYSGPYYVCADCAPTDAAHFGVFLVHGFDGGDMPACPRCYRNDAVTPAPLPSEAREPDTPGEGLNAGEWLRRERGICSVAECDQPIAGWCAECDARGAFQAPKLCAAHLMAHCEAASHTPYLPYERPAPYLDYDGNPL